MSSQIHRRQFVRQALTSGAALACAGAIDGLTPRAGCRSRGEAPGHGRRRDLHLASRRRVAKRNLGHETPHAVYARHEGERAARHLPADSHVGRRTAVRRRAGADRLGDEARHARAQPDQPDQVRRRASEGPVLHDDRLFVSGRGEGPQHRSGGRPDARAPGRQRAAVHLHRPRHRHERHREAVHSRIHRAGLLRRAARAVPDSRPDRRPGHAARRGGYRQCPARSADQVPPRRAPSLGRESARARRRPAT